MRKSSVPAFRSLSALTVSRHSEQFIALESPQEILEASVLAPDLFRLRIASRKTFSKCPSWAVAKTAWNPVSSKVHSSRREAAIETERGKLSMRLHDGFWKLLDRSGTEIFSAVPAATGFS